MIAANEIRSQQRRDARTPCRHCGLELGAAHREELGDFCCEGCRTVHALIREQGLGRYYELRTGARAPASLASSPTEPRRETFAWLEPLLARACDGGEVARLALDIQGVHCAACVWLLEELWRREQGGVDLRINPALGRVEFAWKPRELELADYLRGVERFGYRFGPARKSDLDVSRGLVVRMGVCVAAALNVMIFSLCFYAGLERGEGALYQALGRASFALATVSVLVGGSLFFRSAIESARRRIVHLDLPIALGIALGYVGSVVAWIQIGPEAAYFDTITIFVALMVVGRWLQERVLQRNRHSLLASEGVDDLFTRRRRAGALETIAAASIAPGDELWILPGDLVPVEGTLLGEDATFALDWIDGESRPRRFDAGATVPAGAFQIGERAVRIAASEGFASSRLHALLGAVRRDAKGERGDLFTSRVAKIYVASVLALAATALCWWWSAGAVRAIQVALSVLVITCPCALGLATPLAHELVHAALRRRGIFLRDDGFLHRALRVRHVVFDKTGTLTRGVLRLSARSRRELAELGPGERAVLIDMTARSLHPVSRCVHAELSVSLAATVDERLEVRELPGRGLEARRGPSTWRLGSAEFALGCSERNENGAVFAKGGEVLAVLEIEEQLKSDAAHEVARLEAEGFAIHVLSGDREERVQRVAESLGIARERVHGDLSPEDKARYLVALDRRDTCMIGDGLNDGPAFDAAYCAATPAIDRPNLPARADFFYLGDGIAAVRTALHGARSLSATLKTNLVVATLYNSAAVTLCFLGAVGPLTAAVLMPLSSLALIGLTTLSLSRRGATWTS